MMTTAAPSSGSVQHAPPGRLAIVPATKIEPFGLLRGYPDGFVYEVDPAP
jgi:hypothetical protein